MFYNTYDLLSKIKKLINNINASIDELDLFGITEQELTALLANINVLNSNITGLMSSYVGKGNRSVYNTSEEIQTKNETNIGNMNNLFNNTLDLVEAINYLWNQIININTQYVFPKDFTNTGELINYMHAYNVTSLGSNPNKLTLNPVYSSLGGLNFDVSEEAVIGKDIDGKYIYRKIIKFNMSQYSGLAYQAKTFPKKAVYDDQDTSYIFTAGQMGWTGWDSLKYGLQPYGFIIALEDIGITDEVSLLYMDPEFSYCKFDNVLMNGASMSLMYNNNLENIQVFDTSYAKSTNGTQFKNYPVNKPVIELYFRPTNVEAETGSLNTTITENEFMLTLLYKKA
jgi:hypothetical protein